jgi:hypothetical protein
VPEASLLYNPYRAKNPSEVSNYGGKARRTWDGVFAHYGIFSAQKQASNCLRFRFAYLKIIYQAEMNPSGTLECLHTSPFSSPGLAK